MASRYWVGGSAAWDATAGTKWALTSGGAGGQAVPTASDDVFFSAASSGTVTINTTVNCKSLDCTGFTGTITHSSASGVISVGASGGTFTLGSGMTYNATVGTINFLSTTDNSTTGWPITCAGKSLPAVVFNGVGGKWVLQDTFAGVSMTLTAGDLRTNNQTVTVTTFSTSGTGVRNLVLGSSAYNATTSFTIGTTTNLTYDPGTSTITTPAISGTLTQNNVIVQVSSIPPVTAIASSFSCTNLTITFLNGSDALGIAFLGSGAGITVTVSGTFTANGTAGRRMAICGFKLGVTASTISAGAVSISHVVFMDITATGAATWSGSNIGDGGGNTGITFPTTQSNYWVGGTGDWSDVSHWASVSGGTGGTGRVPLAHDTVVMDASSGSGTVNLNVWCMGKDIDMGSSSVSVTAATVTYSATYFGYSFFGSLTLPTAPAVFNSGPSTNILCLLARTSVNLRSNGAYVTVAGQFILGVSVNSSALPCRLVLVDDMFVGGTFTMRTGSAVDNSGNYTVTADGSFVGGAGSSTNKNNWGTGLYKFTAAATSSQISGTGTNTIASSPSFLYTGSGTKIVAASGITPNVSFTSGTIRYSSASTVLNSLTIPAGGTLTLAAAISIGTLTSNGSSISNATINSSSSGVARTMTVTGSATVNYTSIRDSTAAGAASPITAYNSTNVSNNTNWIFATITAAPAGSFFSAY